MESAKMELVLEDLLRINKECSTTLQDLMHREPMLVSYFQHLVDLEMECLLQLRQQMVRSHGDPANKVEKKGEIYKAWIESAEKTSLNNKEACVVCEKKLNDLSRAYSEAIQKGNELSEQVIIMLKGQIDRVKNGFQLLLRRFSELSQARNSIMSI